MSDHGLFERLDVMVDGGFVSDDEIVAQLPDLVHAQLYVFLDGKLRLDAFDVPKLATGDRAAELARGLVARHRELEAVWVNELSGLEAAFGGLCEGLLAHLAQKSRQRAQLEATWSGRSVNDGIDAAFAELEKQGVIARQNIGYTMGEAWAGTNHEASFWSPPPWGAVFYHGQDLERGVAGQGLLLAFGAYEDDDAKADARSVEVAKLACERLRANGVSTEWDGTIGQRVRIPPFEWRKRRPRPTR